MYNGGYRGMHNKSSELCFLCVWGYGDRHSKRSEIFIYMHVYGPGLYRDRRSQCSKMYIYICGGGRGYKDKGRERSEIYV